MSNQNKPTCKVQTRLTDNSLNTKKESIYFDENFNYIEPDNEGNVNVKSGYYELAIINDEHSSENSISRKIVVIMISKIIVDEIHLPNNENKLEKTTEYDIENIISLYLAINKKYIDNLHDIIKNTITNQIFKDKYLSKTKISPEDLISIITEIIKLQLD